MFDLQQLLRILIFYFLGFPVVFARVFVHWNKLLNRDLGLSLTARYLFVPLFGDYTAAGRVIGAIYRVFRLVLYTVFLVVCDLFLAALFLLWYIFPLVLFYYAGFWAVVILSFLWFLAFIYKRDRHLKYLVELRGWEQVADAYPRAVRRVLSNYNPNHPEKLLLELLNSYFLQRFLVKLGLSPEQVRQLLSKAILPHLTRPELEQQLFQVAQQTKSRLVFAEHIWLVFFNKSEQFQDALLQLELRPEDIQGAVEWVVEEDKKYHPPRLWDADYHVSPIGGVDRARTSRPTPNLDSVSEDLTLKASRNLLPVVVGKEKATNEVIRVLSRGGWDNVLVIGEPGSGKTTLIGGIAQSIVAGTAKDSLQFRRLVSLDPSALASYASSPGELNDKVNKIVKEIKAAGNIILFIDEIHNLAASIQEKPGQSASVFAALQPHISSQNFQVIGATDYANYKKFIEPNGAFARLFQKVELPEASIDESLAILRQVSLDIESKEGVVISFPALRQAVELSSQVIYDRVLPDKAVDLVDEAASLVRGEGRSVVMPNDIKEVVQSRTNIPIKDLTAQDSGKLLNLEDEIHKQVIDQREAITAVADALRRARAGLVASGRPLASFLFVGPTGVGKTETAKALANAYFGGEKMMIRLDMSEYQEQSSINRLVGPPPGHPEAEAGGQLTEAVRRKPFSLILLDEIEKAHADVLLLFLQVLDDARLTDGMGRTVNFSNTIVIATSNVGTSAIQQGVSRGEAFEQIKQEAMQALQSRFKPEFLNRFDGIITFQPLSLEDVVKIAELMLKSLAERLAAKDLRLEYTGELVSVLAQKGFDPQWGARPLRRLIQDQVEAPLAKLIIGGKFKKGEVIKIGVEFLER